MIKPTLKEPKVRIAIVASLSGVACFLTYYFHVVIGSGIVFTHFFYIPIILAALWWKRKGIFVAIFLATVLILSHIFLRVDMPATNDYFRAGMFIVIAFVVAMLSERIAKSEDRLEHLNKVLRAIRNVNQIITREKDRGRLLKGICNNLTETPGYYNVWIALLDESGKLITTAEAGLGKDFLPMVELLKRGELTNCSRKALSQPGIVMTEDPFSFCVDCPLSKNYSSRRAMTIRLEHAGKVYGIMSASIPKAFLTDAEEQSLFKEVVNDIAFALHNIELEEERKQTEEALRENEEKYRTLVENSKDSIVTVDLKGNILFANKVTEELTGYTQEEGIGMNVREIIPLEYQRRSLTNLLKARQGMPIPYFELVIRRKDGRLVPVEAGGQAIHRDGKVVSVQIIARDITERKQAEEREKELQQELHLSSRLASIGELAADVAHELNNPLTGIMGFSERLLRKSTDEKVSRDLERIHNEAQRAATVVQNLLTFARYHEPKKEYSDINKIVQQTLELRAYEIKTSNIEVALDLTPDPPSIMVDLQQIQDVFLNIILNAEQVMTEAKGGGRLTIKTGGIKGYIRTSFTDDGPGISKEHLGKLFDPFFTTRGERGGTGLGLSICHGIVTEHSGRIYAKSKLGKGATFFVELPLPPKEQ